MYASLVVTISFDPSHIPIELALAPVEPGCLPLLEGFEIDNFASPSNILAPLQVVLHLHKFCLGGVILILLFQ